MNWRLSRMLAWRDWRSGELGLLMLALVVAVSSVTAISLFVDRLQQAMLNESADFLAADRYVSSSRALPAEFFDLAQAREVQAVDTLLFPSMVFAGDDLNQLVSVKAVSPGYPLRGQLRVAVEPFAVGVVTQALPELGEVWLDSRLFPALGVALGDTIEVGLAQLKISRVITSEPDRGGAMFDWGPRLLMRMADVPATEVVQPGSRLTYRLLLRGADADLAALKEDFDLQPGQSWVGIKESSPSIGSALSRAERFLLLGGLLAVLLAGLAVVLAASRYARRHYDHVAVLKTLGTGPNAILAGYVGVLLWVAAVAIALGLILGFGLHWLILLALQELMPIELPAPGLRPIVLGAVTGLICTMAFALPAFIHLRNVSPMNVIRRDLGATPPSRYLSYTMAAAGVVGLLLWYTQDVVLTLLALGGTMITLVIFGALGSLLLRGTRVVGTQAGSLWRFALASLQRRHRENLVQMLVIGLAIMLILILVLLRTALLSEWKQQIPEGAPNHFVMNLLPEQVPALQAQLDAAQLPFDEAFAMVRGRVIGVNGQTAKEHRAAQAVPDRPGANIGSERNLTWTATLPEGNSLVGGQWWAETSTASEVSLEEEYAREAGVGLGDELRFDIGGRELSAKVTSLRRLSWESMRPNFFIIFSPGALESFPVTYMTSFHLPVEQKRFLNDLLTRFPTVTVIEVDALIARIQSIISRVTQAVELVLYLVLVAGCLVLVASIQASRDARMHEHALLRALGGTRALVAGTLVIEFAALGLLAGTIGAIGAEVTVALLQTQAFDLPARVHPWVWLLGPLLGAVLIAGVGMISTRSLISTPPMLVLRGLS
jgi:putative ABC transport system permease protein